MPANIKSKLYSLQLLMVHNYVHADKIKLGLPSKNGRPSKRNMNPNENQLIDWACDTHYTNEGHCLGDWEMPPKTPFNVNKILSSAWHSNRQSLVPPTVHPNAYESSPPDEDRLPKHVADSKRSQQQSHNRQIAHRAITNIPFPKNHNGQNIATVKANPSATVTLDNLTDSSPTNRQSTEPIVGTVTISIPPTVPEEAVGSPIHLTAIRNAKALAKMRSTLDRMTDNILKKLDKIQHLSQSILRVMS